MKTLIIYNQIISEMEYYILEGDYTRFNGIMINGVEGNGFEDEFVDLFYDEEGNRKLEKCTDIAVLENKEWDKVAMVTWLP